MSLILVEYDTKKKSMSVKMDGKAVKDVYCVHVYGESEYSEPYISIEKMLINEEEKYREVTNIYASHFETSEESLLDYNKLGEKLSKAMRVE